jgi:hypothetical protein
MKTTFWAATLAVLGAGTAFAQDGDFRREFEKRKRELEERFGVERQKLEKEFREKLMPRREDGGKPRLEELVEKLVERVDRLERRLNENFGEFGRALPKDFDFKKFMPKDGPFRFQFRREGDEEPGDKHPKKEFFEFRKLFERHVEKKHEERDEKKKHDDEKKKKPKEEDNF